MIGQTPGASVYGTGEPLRVQGKEKYRFLAALGSAADRMMHIAGKSWHVMFTQASTIKQECKALEPKALLSVPLRSVAVAASAVFGGVVFLSSVLVRSPLTIGEKTGKVALFRLSERPLKEEKPAASPDFSMLSLNIMGLPAFICGINGMKPCDERIGEIVAVIKEKNPDVVFLEECFLDVYAKKIMEALPSEYQYMVSQVEGGRFTAPYGSGLVIISKHPIEDVSVKQYKELYGADKFSQKGVLSTIVDYKGKKLCLGSTHLQAGAGGLRQGRFLREELSIAKDTVTQMAEKSKAIVTTLIGDMNLNSIEGMYKEVEKAEATHFLIRKQDSEKEEDVIVKEDPIPDGWEVRTFLQEEKKGGVLEKAGWKLSAAYGREESLFSGKGAWKLFSPPESTALAAKSGGRARAALVNVIKKGEKSAQEALMNGEKIFLYSENQIEQHRIKNREGIDLCFFASKVWGVNMQGSVVGVERGGEWAQNVSDHRAIHVVLKGLV